MPATVRTEGPLFDGTLEERAGAVIRFEFAKMGDVLARYVIDQSPEYRGDFKAGVGFTIEGAGFDTALILFDDAEDAYFVEEGRPAGKQPPPEVMLTWVQARRLAENTLNARTAAASNIGKGLKLARRTKPRRMRNPLSEQKSIAFLVGRAIGRKGLPGFHIYSNLRENMAWYIDDEIDRIQERVVNMLAA